MIVSITNEIAIDEGSIFAGGLGVLEADKFYAMARLNKEYLVLTPFYPKGYIGYEFKNNHPVAVEDRFPETLLSKLKEIYKTKITLKDFSINLAFYEYKLNTASIVFIKILDENLANEYLGRLYDHEQQKIMFYRYLIISKACLNFLSDYIGFKNIEVIDLQESFFAFLPLFLVEYSERPKIRLILHTPVPWGHPNFLREYFKNEMQYDFIEREVNMTTLAASLCDEIITVSRKHEEVSKKMLPQFSKKIRHVTNGIEIYRWMDPELLKHYQNNTLNVENLKIVKEKAKLKFFDFLKNYKDLKKENMLISWTRRTVTYKRPYFVLNFIEENPELNVNFFLAGKTDPRDNEGLSYMKRMKEISERYPNVVYIWKYDTNLAKMVFQASDLILFTPLSGWEASGTSMMKAGINGTPTLSSKDGASLELIKDGYNGWFFGEELRELVLPGSPRAWEVDSHDYEAFSNKLKMIIEMWNKDKDKFYEIALNAILSFIPYVSADRMLKEYYG